MRNKKIFISVIILSISIILLSISIAFSLNKNMTENTKSQSGFDNSQNDNIEINNTQDDKKKKEREILFGSYPIICHNEDMGIHANVEKYAEDIVLAKVTKFGKAIYYDSISSDYMDVFTTGEIKIIKAYKGGLQENSLISFAKMGGVISYYEYEITLTEEQKVAFLDPSYTKWTVKEKKNKYIETVLQEDIEIKKGKTYLFYMNYSENLERYNLIIQRYGAREYDSKTDMILNNTTGEWEANPYTKTN